MITDGRACLSLGLTSSYTTLPRPCGRPCCGFCYRDVHGDGYFLDLAGEPNPFQPLDEEDMKRRNYSRYTRMELSDFPDERTLSLAVLGRLESWFTVEREVSGTHCSGKRCRIDAILRARSLEGRPALGLPFGIEFKQSGDWADGVKQAVDYTHVEWDNVGRVPIFCCPMPNFGWASAPRDVEHPEVWLERERALAGILDKLLGKFRIGKVTVIYGYGLALELYGGRVWTERAGFTPGTHGEKSLRVRVGHPQ